MSNDVYRFLITGTDEQLIRFHLAVCMALNAVERRAQTVLYTCLDQDRAEALQCADVCGVTVQEWIEQEWKIIAGEGPGWEPDNDDK